ncbi:MAG: thioredoxin family protein, partial [Candidatus Thiodiazotropha sp.]
YEKVSEDHENIVFGKVNTEEEQELAMHFQVRSIPTLMIFRDNIIIFSQPGALPESAFRELLSKAGELDMDEVRAQVEAEQQKGQNA